MMKKVVFIIVILLISRLAFSEEQMIEIVIKGMTCSFCQDGLNRNLDKLPGVQHADVSLKQKKARIIMKDGQTLDEKILRDTIIDSGFTPGAITKVQ